MADTKEPSKARLLSACPQFAVPDVVAAAEYYRDTLGFRILDYFCDPPVFVIVVRDSVEIQLGKLDPNVPPSPNNRRRSDGLDAYIWVNDIGLLFSELKQRGARILEGPVKREYGCEEVTVEDLNGFHIVFAESVEPAKGAK